MSDFFSNILTWLNNAADMLSFDGLYLVGIIISIPMVAIFVLESFDRRVSLRWPFLRVIGSRWNTKAVSVMAMTAALSVVLQVLSAVIVLIPGTLTLRIDAMVRNSFGGIFGMPAVWGTMLANIIGDALSGTLGPGSIAGFMVSWFQAYFFFRLMSNRQAAMESGGSLVRYYLISILVCVIGAFFLCANFQILGLLPPQIIWTVVFPGFMVSTFLGGLLGPVLARVIAPIASRYGLTRDEMNYEGKRSAMPELSTDRAPTPTADASSEDLSSRPVIDITGLEYAYRGREDLPVLRDINFQAQAGSFIVITGRTGSGKSTLCLTLNGLIPHSLGGVFEGKVKVGGLDTSATDMPTLGRTVGIVQQNPESQIIGLTVGEDTEFGLENLALPMDEIGVRAAAALAEVGLQDVVDRSPLSLSGGQKQRLAISSSIALRPQVLVLDNPTAELDPIGRADVLRTIARLNREHGITIIIVTQEIFEALPYADRLVVLEEGRIAVDGAPRDVLQSPAQLRDLGVKVPDIIELADALAQRGAWRGPMPLAIEEAEAEIRSIIALAEAKAGRGTVYQGRSPQLSERKPLVHFKDVHFSYGSGPEILKGIDLTIGEGEFVAVMGANGAGKTTLGKHLNGLLQPTAGQVIVDGKNTLENSVAGMAGSVGYVFQNPDHQIVCRHLADELALGPQNLGWPQDRIDAAVERVMSFFGFDDRDADPFFMGLAGRNLVALASSLMMEPRILVLDEPATGADHGMVKRLMNRVAELHRGGLTVVMVTHDAAIVADYAERLIVVNGGLVAFDGTPTEVFREGEALVDCQISPPPILHLTSRLVDVGVPVLCRVTDTVEALAREETNG